MIWIVFADFWPDWSTLSLSCSYSDAYRKNTKNLPNLILYLCLLHIYLVLGYIQSIMKNTYLLKPKCQNYISIINYNIHINYIQVKILN